MNERRLHKVMQTRIMHGHTKECLDECIPFQPMIYFLCRSTLRGISQHNCHLLIINDHGSHVTIEILEQAIEFGPIMVTLPSHISHTLQPLDVTCFKPFKIALRKEHDVIMAKSNLLEPNKITLVEWVDKALQQSLKKENMKSGFSVCRIWPLNSIDMAKKFGPSEVSLQQKKEILKIHTIQIQQCKPMIVKMKLKLPHSY
jgi:hypothetical protein